MEPQTEKSRGRRLHRSRTERIVFGVCGGLAEHVGVDPNLVRLAFVAVALLPPVSLLSLVGYSLLAILTPDEGAERLPARDALRGNLTALGAEMEGLVSGVGARVVRLTGGRLPPLDEAPLDEAVPASDTGAALERGFGEAAAAPGPDPAAHPVEAQR